MLFNNYLKSVENNITYNINNCNFLSKYFESNSNINFNLELYDALDILENIDKIDKTHTKFGFFHLKNKILNPTDDDQKLVFNKNNIVITSNPKVYNFIKLNLEKISSLQHSIIQLFDDDFIKNDNIEKIYFKDYLKNLKLFIQTMIFLSSPMGSKKLILKAASLSGKEKIKSSCMI